jgi:hypothetical protein
MSHEDVNHGRRDVNAQARITDTNAAELPANLVSFKQKD